MDPLTCGLAIPSQNKTMANEEQLEILKSGMIAWNVWRAKQDGLENPDFAMADLSGAQSGSIAGSGVAEFAKNPTLAISFRSFQNQA